MKTRIQFGLAYAIGVAGVCVSCFAENDGLPIPQVTHIPLDLDIPGLGSVLMSEQPTLYLVQVPVRSVPWGEKRTKPNVKELGLQVWLLKKDGTAIPQKNLGVVEIGTAGAPTSYMIYNFEKAPTNQLAAIVVQAKGELYCRRIGSATGPLPCNDVHYFRNHTLWGILGKPLGSQVRIHGEYGNSDFMTNVVLVRAVDGVVRGMPLPVEIRGIRVDWGIHYKLEGYEAGEFTGIPDWIHRSGEQPFQYRTFFVVTKVVGTNGLPVDGASSAARTPITGDLSKQISEILAECQKIKPRMTRAELLKVFTPEGGISNARHRTYVHRRSPYIKIDVDFDSSNPAEEQPTDKITNISKPYLDWSVAD